MNPELQKKLEDAFPELFGAKNCPLYQRGIECGDGWFRLIWTICSTLKQNALACELNLKFYEFHQVKEKFGALIIYPSASDEFSRGVFYHAEFMSRFICEECGTTIDVGRTKGYIKTICLPCYKLNRANSNWESNKI